MSHIDAGSVHSGAMLERRCPKCETVYFGDQAEAMCRYGWRDISRQRLRSGCIACEQDARDAAKATLDGRWRAKVRDSIRRHAKKAVDRGLLRCTDEIETLWGWDRERLIHEGQHAYENGCSYCGGNYEAMGHGLQDITLDVVDPSAPWYFPTNVRWCCQTCNREKSTTPPHLWAAKLAGYRMRSKWLSESPIRIHEQQQLFT